MGSDMVTTNISLPRTDWKALKVLAVRQETSMSDLIRRSVKQSIKQQVNKAAKKQRLTVNGFTPEFEDEVLKAAAEPVDYSKVWETDEDIHKFFRSVGKEIARRKQ